MVEASQAITEAPVGIHPQAFSIEKKCNQTLGIQVM